MSNERIHEAVKELLNSVKKAPTWETSYNRAIGGLLVLEEMTKPEPRVDRTLLPPRPPPSQYTEPR